MLCKYATYMKFLGGVDLLVDVLLRLEVNRLEGQLHQSQHHRGFNLRQGVSSITYHDGGGCA